MTETAYEHRRRDRIDLTLLIISRATRSFAAGFIAVIIGIYYAYSLDLTLTLVGILFGSGAVGTPLITLVLGRLADKYGRKKILLISLLSLPAAVSILLLTTYYPLLMLSAAIGGFGIAGGLVGGGVGATAAPMQTALLAEKTNSANRTTVFSLFTIISNLSGATGALLANIHSYHLLFTLAIVISLFSVASILPLKEDFRRKPKTTSKSQKTPASKRNRNIIAKFGATGAINGSAQGLIIPFIPIILGSKFLMSNGAIGDLFAIGGLLTAGFMSLTPYLTRKLGFVRMIMGTRAVSTSLMLAFPFASGAVLASVLYVGFTAFRAISLPSQQSLMMSLVNEDSRASATGVNQTARLLPSAASTTGSGVLQDYMSVVIPFEIAFVFNFVNIFLYYRFFWNEEAGGIIIAGKQNVAQK